MYHVDVLLSLADIRDAFRAAYGDLPGDLDELIEKMAQFLGHILHPDGQIPLFGDSTLDLTPSPRQVFARLRMDFPNLQPEQAVSRQVGDYWVYREGGKFLIFDAGPVGPDHLPAHAHADLLNLEASWAGQRLFVDAGVHDYEDSPERAYCRSTAAHNTLEINGQNQCDVWSRFRMGRRGWPGPLFHDQVGPFHYAWCTHNAYRNSGCPEIKRLTMCIEDGPWLIVDSCMGTAGTSMASRSHVCSSWTVLQSLHSHAVLECPSERLVLEPGSTAGHVWESQAGKYYPEFNLKKEAKVFMMRGVAPNVLVWQIRSETSEQASCAVLQDTASFVYQGSECVVFDHRRT